MSREDRQLDCMCERNNRRRKWAEEAEMEETLHRQAQKAGRRTERRRAHYRRCRRAEHDAMQTGSQVHERLRKH